MASITKHAGGYRAQIKLVLRAGEPYTRDSKSFPTRREAIAWGVQREQELRDQASSDPRLQHTLRAALRRYAAEVSPSKRGARWEKLRLSAFETYDLPLDKPLLLVTPQDIAKFRDSRASTVQPATIRREIVLLSAVFMHCRQEWRWVDGNPCTEVRKPPPPKHRERVLQWWEIKRMLREMNYQRTGRPASFGHAVALCMLLALRTGMRAGELTSLRWEQVFDRHCHLPTTKSGRPRDVPLSTRALKILERMRGWDETLVFGIKAASLDALFRKYRQRAGLEGFTWHDTRHTAATMLSKKVAVLDLCKIFGWTDPKMAMIYYNPHASTLADLLG